MLDPDKSHWPLLKHSYRWNHEHNRWDHREVEPTGQMPRAGPVTVEMLQAADDSWYRDGKQDGDWWSYAAEYLNGTPAMQQLADTHHKAEAMSRASMDPEGWAILTTNLLRWLDPVAIVKLYTFLGNRIPEQNTRKEA